MIRTPLEQQLADKGVFLGHGGPEGLLNADAFWENQPYGTRLYYGDGLFDYLHRSVLRAAIEIMKENGTSVKMADQPDATREAIMALQNEVNCRIQHGADSGGHLDYVQAVLDMIINPETAP